jgi:hypothetical protein
MITGFKKEEGISVFLKGSTPTFIGSMIASIFHLTLYQKFMFLFKFTFFHEDSIFETHSLDIFKIKVGNSDASNEDKLESTNSRLLLVKKLSILAGIAGFFSGIFLSLITTPIDNIRIRLQSMQNLQMNTKGHDYLFTSPRECISSVLRQKGLKGFFIAFPVCMFRESFASLIYFYTFEYMKNSYKVVFNKEELPLHITFIIGGFSGMMNWIITLPIDCVKTKLISDSMSTTKKFEGVRDCIVKTHKEFGIKGFFSGLSVMLVRAYVANGAMFTSFETCRNLLMD